MSYDDILKTVQALTRNAETLAAISALLSARTGGKQAAGEVAKRLDAVVHAIDPALLDGLDDEQATALHALTLANLNRVNHFAHNPDRPAQWVTDDPLIIQSQGKGSRIVARLVTAFAEKEAGLGARLERPCRFLDVGSGAGWISIALAQRWPALDADGFDVLALAVELAVANAANLGLADRLSFHLRSVEEIDAEERYAVAFIPFIFIPEAVLTRALPLMYRALEPGGWLFAGSYRMPGEPLADALVGLQTTLSGGRTWAPEKIAAALSAAGLDVHGDIGTDSGIHLYAGRKP